MDLDKEKLAAFAHEALRRWDCRPDGEIVFTQSSLLWPVQRANEKVMLKVANPYDDEANAADVLRFYSGEGAVALLESAGSAQLLERCDDTGHPALKEMVSTGQDDAATRVICGVIARLHRVASTKKPPANLIPFRQRSDELRLYREGKRVREEDRPTFQIACDLCQQLIMETADSQMPLHGDIHHLNILRSARRGWLAIDPKGILGPRAYEYCNSLCNPYGHPDIVVNPVRMDRQASIMCEQANLNRNLLLRFTFLHAMQCAAWSLFEPDYGYWLACATTAASLAKIKLPG